MSIALSNILVKEVFRLIFGELMLWCTKSGDKGSKTPLEQPLKIKGYQPDSGQGSSILQKLSRFFGCKK
jgi:hypothetical protein